MFLRYRRPKPSRHLGGLNALGLTSRAAHRCLQGGQSAAHRMPSSGQNAQLPPHCQTPTQSTSSALRRGQLGGASTLSASWTSLSREWNENSCLTGSGPRCPVTPAFEDDVLSPACCPFCRHHKGSCGVHSRKTCCGSSVGISVWETLTFGIIVLTKETPALLARLSG